MTSRQFKVRPLANEKTSMKDASHLYINRSVYIQMLGTLDADKSCTIENIEGTGIPRQASLDLLVGQNINTNIVLMSSAFQEACGFKLGDTVRITPNPGAQKDAGLVVVEDITIASQGTPPDDEEDIAFRFATRRLLSIPPSHDTGH